MTFTMKKELQVGYDEALARVPEALKSEGFGILTEIDVAATFRKKLGVERRPYRIFGACNPTLAHQALSHDPSVGTMLPCNVVVYEGDDGKAVVLAIDPVQTVAAAQPALIKMATTVRDKLARVLEKL